ncbi:23917_t:CDS:2 [Gigaspora margarita]|uniref:23917_t:CDS:1 n=1 Tax=Gigaspora margarita TaxID=4874 RepID=A0ABN7UKX8_GIGMA|nr:23917_t:CDS:2 [Gigaspora margarita]
MYWYYDKRKVKTLQKSRESREKKEKPCEENYQNILENKEI